MNPSYYDLHFILLVHYLGLWPSVECACILPAFSNKDYVSTHISLSRKNRGYKIPHKKMDTIIAHRALHIFETSSIHTL